MRRLDFFGFPSGDTHPLVGAAAPTFSRPAVVGSKSAFVHFGFHDGEDVAIEAEVKSLL